MPIRWAAIDAMQLWPETACSQVGYHIDYTPDELRERYGSPQNYIDPK